jgi:hypothetical protein
MTCPLGHVFEILPRLPGDARPRGVRWRRGQAGGRTPAAARPNVGPVKTNLLRRAGDQRQLASFSRPFQEPRLWWVVIPARMRGGQRWLSACKHQPIFEEQCR